MTPSLLRQFWYFVEQTQVGILLSLDDCALQRWLLNHFSDTYPLEQSQRSHLETYISSRLMLIRDMVGDRP
ncbi:hypothetical protein L5470_12790 [Synechococcus sp. PCC 6717]|jgi:hypothetical protein|uniref:Uncharacterized protein n=1 Tax=Parathermosynechococcus lividus PCC 6715 TaxID=1917166 RepID=A0A2D2PZW0_PARLV|nr:hypothetical protein [Thermostichus lividus]ATS17795.1 hypothetical protein BRW62_02455 [Thermostichus lividus PCC 6715]MCH9056179.1 hypothetical protein [Synechococcus sp. PCC 6716]MCI3281829.1 hypothetical protein [Synechococcus sp. PCC 6717]